jgi:hypothetical protein
VVIRDGENLVIPILNPLPLGYPLTLGTMTVTTGVVADLSMVAFRTLIKMISQPFCSAIKKGRENPFLFRGEASAFTKLNIVFSYNIC